MSVKRNPECVTCDGTDEQSSNSETSITEVNLRILEELRDLRCRMSTLEKRLDRAEVSSMTQKQTQSPQAARLSTRQQPDTGSESSTITAANNREGNDEKNPESLHMLLHTYFDRNLTSRYNTTIFMMTLAIACVIVIISLVLGLANFGECPVNELVPMYLILSGGFGCLAVGTVTNSFAKYRGKKLAKEDKEELRSVNEDYPWLIQVHFRLIAIIAGLILGISLWSNWRNLDFDNTQSSYYCDKPTYLFAYGMLAAHIFLALSQPGSFVFTHWNSVIIWL